MRNPPLLSIIIPTYNRPQSLEATLRKLVPQLNENVALKVIDNGSDYDVAALVADTVAPHTAAVVKNRVNIGLSGNLVKCFEHCSTEWLWMLSDDDHPHSDAVERALAFIQTHPDLVFAGFITPLLMMSKKMSADVEFFQGLNQAVEVMPSFSNFLFISTNLYRADKLRAHIKEGYHFSYTFAPFVAMLLQHLRQHPEAKGAFINQAIVAWGKHSTERPSWQASIVDRVVQDIISLVPDHRARKQLYHLIRACLPYPFLSVRELVRTFFVADRKSVPTNLLLSSYLTSLSYETAMEDLRPLKRTIKIAVPVALCLAAPLRPLFAAVLRRTSADSNVLPGAYANTDY